MTIHDLYTFFVRKGMELDPRSRDALDEQMTQARSAYDAADEGGKLGLDTERFTNPYGDTRIVHGDPGAHVRRIVCGIDIDGTEILMADRLRDHGRPVDLVLGHHPSAIGGALGSRVDTIWPQVALSSDFGVPEHVATKLVRKASQGDERSYAVRVNQIAQVLGIPLMTVHSPADLCVYQEAQRVLSENRPKTVGELVELSDGWPEVQWLRAQGKGTEIAVGDARDPLGKVYCGFFGGWNPSPELFEALCDAACGTLWVMATSEALNEVARKRHASIVVTPHHPADNIGLNLLLDAAQAELGEFDIIECSNFKRIAR